MRSDADRIVLLGGTSESTRMVWHALRRAIGPVPAIIEQSVPLVPFLRRRVRRLGVLKVAGQVGFMAAALPVLRRRGADRIEQVRREHELDVSPITGDVTNVGSANSRACRERLQELDPDVVVVNGTRILDSKTLGCVDATFINMHAGITPFCRGVHGGYWALVDGRPDLVGTTVHVVDEGIDTGAVIAQATFEPSARDSFATYPTLHTAAGLPLLVQAVRDALAGSLELRAPLVAEPSKLRTHPTLWGYAWTRLSRRVS